MTTIVKNFNTDLNFWEMNPIFKTVKLFRDFHDSDKSKKKETSSQIMWAIVLLIDPNEANIWKNVNEDDKKKGIAEDYLKDIDFDWNKYQSLLDEYENKCLTIAEKELIRFERKLVDRGNFINKTNYSLDSYEDGRVIKGTAESLDKMMLNTSKLNEQLSTIKDMLKQEESQGSLRAGAEKSASEKGEI